jgi:preprotein translocase subunit SecE
MANPFEFIQQVRAEAAKVVWPTRRETLVTTGLVLMLVVFTSLFFLVVDQVLREVVSLVLGFGRGGYPGS